MVDNKGNTYTPCGAFVLNSVTYRMFYTVVTAGGTGLVVTANWSTAAAARATLVAQYFNGFTGTPTLDKTNTGTGTSTTAAPSNTAVTTQAAELVVVGAGHAGISSAFSLGSGYTNLGTVAVANAGIAQESKVVAATGAQSGSLTIASSLAWAAFIATFYDLASGPAPIPNRLKAASQAVNRGASF
jgi:hypothetical protein